MKKHLFNDYLHKVKITLTNMLVQNVNTNDKRGLLSCDCEESKRL